MSRQRNRGKVDIPFLTFKLHLSQVRERKTKQFCLVLALTSIASLRTSFPILWRIATSGSSDTEVIASERGIVSEDPTSPTSLIVTFSLPVALFIDKKFRLVSMNCV